MISRSYKFKNSDLTIRFGNIIDSKSEVIVSSDDCYLTMGGGVSCAICSAGGTAIRKDANKHVPVPLGDVVVTTAGNLKPQKYIFHCITIGQNPQNLSGTKNVTAEDIYDFVLQHTVDRCFQLVHAMDISSIAFPAIGGGVAGFPFQTIVDKMSQAISHNLVQTNKSLKVEIFLFDISNRCTESDFISFFECLAQHAALVKSQHNSLMDDKDPISRIEKTTDIRKT